MRLQGLCFRLALVFCIFRLLRLQGGKAFNVPGWREKSAAGFLYALFLVFLIFQLGGNSAADMPLRLILVQDGFYLLVQLGVHIF